VSSGNTSHIEDFYLYIKKNREQKQGDKRERDWTVSECPFNLVYMTLKLSYYLVLSPVLTAAITLLSDSHGGTDLS